MNRREAEELLPWFINGTLSAEETRAVQAFIDSGQISAAEVNETALFAETISEQSEHEPAYNQGLLNNVMAQLDGMPQEAPEEPLVVREAEPPGLLNRLLAALQWQQTPSMAKLALGAQFAAVLALALFIALPNDSALDEVSYQTVSGTPVMADLSIAFTSGVSESELRELLISVDAKIVDGPNSMGVYAIQLSADADTAQLQALLAASPLTSFVQPVAEK
jgi:hypothetical protein